MPPDRRLTVASILALISFGALAASFFGGFHLFPHVRAVWECVSLTGACPASESVAIAAWAQAIGSVLAVGAAFAVFALQRRAERLERKDKDELRAKAIALYLRYDLLAWIGQLERARDNPYHLMSPAMPKSLSSRLDELPLLGKPGVVLMMVVSLMTTHQILVDEGMLRWPAGSEEQRNALRQIAAQRLNMAVEMLRPLMPQLDALIGLPSTDELPRPQA